MNNNWYIITNTENLIHFINYGLIIDKQGFMQVDLEDSSYLIDAMTYIPHGYIPCFTSSKVNDALQKAREEDENLKGCLLEIDIKQLNQVEAWCGFEQSPEHIYNQKRINSTDELSKSQHINCVLLPAPLPFSLIKNITLQDAETRNTIQEIYQQKFKSWSTRKSFITVKSFLFKASKQTNNDTDMFNEGGLTWQVEPKALSYQKAFSYGGALGLLYYQTKNGRHTTDIFKEISQIICTPDSAYQELDRISAVIPLFKYLINNELLSNDIVIVYKLLIDGLAVIDNHGDACEYILSVLKSDNIPDKYQDKCFKFSKSLEKIVDRTNDKDPETILKIIINDLYPEDIDFKNLAFLITLFFLRDHPETLLKYHHDHFNESSYAMLAIFFGLTSGSVNIPDPIRQSYELSSWLSFKMAEYMHAYNDKLIAFKSPVKPPLMYQDFIKPKPSKSHKVHSFYEWLDKRLELENEGITTALVEWKIALPKRYTVEDNKYLLSDGKPDILATVNIELLEQYNQSNIRKDDLFDFNAITTAYKKFNK